MKNLIFISLLGIVAIIIGFFIYKPSPPSKTKDINIVNKKTQLKKTMIKITSPSFDDQGLIPKKYTCDGENINPSAITRSPTSVRLRA